jgi:type IV pilus assembly protein PilY1
MIAPRLSACSSRRLGTCLGGALLLAVLLPCSRAFAQAEAQKPAPNVLLLVDSSGSMEFQVDGSPVDCAATTPRQKSRWIDMVEVLTGTFEGYSCLAQDRSQAAFRNEFSLGGVAPYDFGYVNPYHRAVSNGCAYGPGVVPPASTPYAWPNKAVNTFPVVGGLVDRSGAGDLATYTGCSGFRQTGDGLLDVYRDMVRFGLMTFDARVGAGTGVAGTAADYTSGFDGNWSYFLNNSPMTGHPGNCSFDMDQEVGARSAAAPPWEGRMINFGAPNETDNSLRNRWIQEVLLSTRPYGATPIAGQLDDARQFLWNDTSTDPLDSTHQFGPSNDPNWRAPNCRKTILILLTDGEPNLDLRPFCEAEDGPGQTAGRCPYQKPEDIVRALRRSPPQASMAIETYVVGFALGRVTPSGGVAKSCADLTDAECAAPANNVPDQIASKNIQACCTLNKIAAAGGEDANNSPRKAYFAENRAELKAIFTDILDDVIQVATRTMPVFSSPGGDTTSKGYKFFSAFDPRPDPTETQLWEGILERRRYVCSNTLAPELKYDPLEGDDFAANINQGAGVERRFYTVIAPDSANAIRPFIESDADGLGDVKGTQVLAERPNDLAAKIPPSAMALTTPPASCPVGSTSTECRDLIVEHLVGLRNDAGLSRCTAAGCKLFGAIYHSVPTAVPGRPSELLRDESYEAFQAKMKAVERPSVLYTSTVDGFLHAFNLAPFPGGEHAEENAVDEPENNELWSFIPPAVLPVLHTQYPKTPMVLLDGVPVIKDVVATMDEVDPTQVDSYQRLQVDAEGGVGSWRSVLVQGFGDSQVGGGFFAIDVTDPRREVTAGPTFRWQLTRSASGKPLFGAGGTPLITTVFLDADTDGPREVAVAVLPGGNGLPDDGVAFSQDEVTMDADPTEYSTNRSVRQYTATEEARSLTIVRLDTGEVIKTFRPASSAPLFKSEVFISTLIPSPITGQPRAFPDTTGAVADRIYVGDRDGRLWRVDVSSQDPDEWTMQVFYDAFQEDDSAFEAGQPVFLPPVLSVDEVGDVTVAFATGSQNLDNSANRVISLTERLKNNEFVAHVNWIQKLAVGDRVTGPMVLFNSGLYYAVSRPPETSGAACDVGSSKVYGAHYIESEDFQRALARDELPNPKLGPAKAPGALSLEIIRQAGLVFGVSLEAAPTCSSEEEAVSGNETFGYGEVRMSRTVKPGSFFLTFDASGNNSKPDSRGVLEVRQPLENPELSVSFSSWAAVYE